MEDGDGYLGSLEQLPLPKPDLDNMTVLGHETKLNGGDHSMLENKAEAEVPVTRAAKKRKHPSSIKADRVKNVLGFKGFKKRILAQTSGNDKKMDDIVISKKTENESVTNQMYETTMPDITITKDCDTSAPNPRKCKSTPLAKGRDKFKQNLKFKALKEHQKRCLLENNATPGLQNPSLAPSSPANPNVSNFKITRKVYLCSACGTYYENWNLFLHMRTVHKRYICLFCLGMFSHAEKLSAHLSSKHNVIEKKFTDKNALFETYKGACFFMCCACEHVFTERDNFSDHDCGDYAKACTVCGNKGAHKRNCKMIPKARNVNKPSPCANTIQHAVKKPLLPVKLPVNKTVQTKPKSKISPNEHVTGDLIPKPEPSQVQTSLLEDQNNTVNKSPTVLDTSELKNDAPIEISSELKAPVHVENETNLELKILDSIPDNSVDRVQESQCAKTQELKEECADKIFVQSLAPVDEKRAEENISTEQVLEESKTEHFNNETLPKESQICDEMFQELKVAEELSGELNNCDVKPIESDHELNDDNLKINSDIKVTEPVQNKVPKLTVKLPKTFCNTVYSDSDLDSDDSDRNETDVNTSLNDSKENGDDMVEGNVSLESSDLGLNKDSMLDQEMEDKTNDADKTDDKIENNFENRNGEVVDRDEKHESGDEVETLQIAGDDIAVIDLTLEQPLHKFPIIELLKTFLSYTKQSCLHCNHARKIAVNGKQLGLHFIAQHKFRATVDSITAEELLPETIVLRIKQSLGELSDVFFNLENYNTSDINGMVPYDGLYECFTCKFVTHVHKELYLHNRKMHQKAILLCIMCKSTFYTYSELLCHFCPGNYVQNPSRELTFRCCLCDLGNLPSAFRLMVHLRKRHHACDVCLESCGDQSKLSNHVWKHKLHHICYRCGIAYRNKPDITKHLFWKHGTESVLCKKCLQKKWPHVYHFCTPPNSFVCEECSLSFTKAVNLKVHKRVHNSTAPYPCTEEQCEQKFISKKLLLKHVSVHNEILPLRLDDLVPKSVNELPKDVTNKDQSAEAPEENVGQGKENIEVKRVKKSKKSKKSKDKIGDAVEAVVADLPALNLSESDSSDESDAELKPLEAKPETVKENTTTVNPVGEEVDRPEPEDEVKPAPILDGIWDNFKTYQASIGKEDETKLWEEIEDVVEKPEPQVILHVCQSDHDYIDFEESPAEKVEEVKERVPSPIAGLPKKKLKTPKKKSKRSNSSSSSSSDSSSSSANSNCTCTSSCSCSSSCSSSSSSDSSSDSDSSSSEMRQKAPSKKERKREEKRAKKKSETSIAASNTSAVDVTTMDDAGKSTEARDVLISESDLETEESETDEDFYDEHPQRLANKLLEEKRNQLMLLAAVPPTHNGVILGNSRSSTPSLPPEEITPKKKIKTKKRKKEKKSRSSTPVQPDVSLKINIPVPSSFYNQHVQSPALAPVVEEPIAQAPLPAPPVVTATTTMAAPPIPYANSMDSDSKRASKRRRIPNKFYGYTSDEELGVLKPTPPPQLTWRKEDLPTPAVAKAPQLAPPKIVEPPRVPPLPVHQILQKVATQFAKPDCEFEKTSESESDSSDEGALHISQPAIVTKPAVVVRPHFPPPAGARQAREGESVYCYCRCPYDEVSEMIACDGNACSIEWFHFECVGIMVPPKGKWYCPDCRQKQAFADNFMLNP